MRAFLRAVLTLVLRVFFRRIDVTGAEHVPASGPVVFAANHPNSLIDPLFLFCLAPRRVSFLAKEPLFRAPVVRWFVRALDSIPVHRRQDAGSDPAKNRETFARARDVLERGGAIAIFPEGASHSDPKLRTLKTGAARIALGAAALSRDGAAVEIVPAGLYYTAKQTFRSRAVLTFGPVVPVPALPLAPGEEPPPDAVRELTRVIERALADVTVQAESARALDLVARAQAIFSWEEEGPAAERDLRRRFLEGAEALRRRDPERFARLERRVRRFEEERGAAGLGLETLKPGALETGGVFRLLGKNALAFLLFPVSVAGALLHYPAYRLAGSIARRNASEEDVVSTLKVTSSLFLFPATWILAGAAAALLFGVRTGVVVLLLAPISGYAALTTSEALDAIVGRARGLAHLGAESYATRRLIARRRAIRDEILRAAEEIGDAPASS